MMKVILLDTINHLGGFGDKVNVKAGYARNFLIPREKAVLATKKNIEYFEARRIDLENKLTKCLLDATSRAEKINALGVVTILVKTGKEGKLFGSVGVRDIINSLNNSGISVTKNEIRLTNGNLRTVGQHKINLQLHNRVSAELIINILPK